MSIFSRKVTSGKVTDPQAGTAETAAKLAAIAADTIAKVYGHRVTYAPGDLVFVDQAIMDLAISGLDGKDQTVGAFGCLMGEIIVRSDGATWFAGATNPFELRLSERYTADPISAIFKNAEAPTERSAVAFRQQCVDLMRETHAAG